MLHDIIPLIYNMSNVGLLNKSVYRPKKKKKEEEEERKEKERK